MSAADVVFGGLRRREVLGYIAAPIVGCAVGAILANLMFRDLGDQRLRQASGLAVPSPLRGDPTAGLLVVVFSLAGTRRAASAAGAVGAYIGAAYFFTSSTSFANPAMVGALYPRIGPADAADVVIPHPR